MANKGDVTLKVNIESDISDLQKAFDEIKKETKDLNKQGAYSAGWFQLDEINKKIAKTAGLMGALKKKFNNISIDTVKLPDKDYDKLAAKLEKTTEKYEAQSEALKKHNAFIKAQEKMGITTTGPTQLKNENLKADVEELALKKQSLELAIEEQNILKMYPAVLEKLISLYQTKVNVQKTALAPGNTREEIKEAQEELSLEQQQYNADKERIRQKMEQRQYERQIREEIEAEARATKEKEDAEKLAAIRAGDGYQAAYESWLIMENLKTTVDYINNHGIKDGFEIDGKTFLGVSAALEDIRNQFEHDTFDVDRIKQTNVNAAEYLKGVYADTFDSLGTESEKAVAESERAFKHLMDTQEQVENAATNVKQTLGDVQVEDLDLRGLNEARVEVDRLAIALKALEQLLQTISEQGIDVSAGIGGDNAEKGARAALSEYSELYENYKAQVDARQEALNVEEKVAEQKRIELEEAEALLRNQRAEAAQQEYINGLLAAAAENKREDAKIPPIAYEIPEISSHDLEVQGADKLEIQIAKAQEQVIGLVEEMHRLAEVRTPTPQYEELDKIIQANEKQIAKLSAEMQKMALSGDAGTDEYKEKEATLRELTTLTDRYRAAQTALVESGNAFNIGDQAGIDAAAEKIGMFNNKIEVLKAALARKQEDATAAEMEKKSIPIYQRVTSAIKKLVNAMALSKAGKKALGKEVDSLRKRMKKGAVFITKYFLGFRSLFFLVRKLRRAIGEGITNLYKYDQANNQTTKALDSMATSIQFIKNAWGAAFAPVINYVMPILTTLMDMLAEAGNAVARFIARFTGQEKVIQAVKVEKKFSDETEKTASGAGKAAKETEKLNDRLADFDDLNVLGEDKPTNTTGSGGGGGSKPDEDVSKMFTTIDTAPNFADSIKEAIAAEDFSGIGLMIGEKMRDSLESIDWESIKAKFTSGARMLATFMNGFFGTPGLFTSIGTTIGNAIDTALVTLNTWYTETDFKQVGTSIANAINGVLKTPNLFANLGKTLANSINVKLETVGSFLGETDWSLLGEKIVETITNFFETFEFEELGTVFNNAVLGAFNLANGILQNIDGEEVVNGIFNAIKNTLSTVKWSEIGDSIGKFITGAIKFTTEALRGVIKLLADGLLNVVDYFEGKIEESGGNVALGILKGIADPLINVMEWLDKHVMTPLVEGFCSLFGIHSPSTVMAGLGEMLVQGLYNGINGIIDIVLTPFRWVGEQLSKIWNGIKEVAIKVWNYICDRIEGIVKTIKRYIVEPFLAIKEKVEEVFGAVKDFVLEIWDGIKDGMKTVINAIISVVEGFVNGIIDGINFLLSGVDKVSGMLGDLVGQDWSISQLSKVSIPRLAQGAVIPPNKEFLAVLGDQKSGTNIEAPLDTIVDAFRDVVGNINVENTGASVMEVDGQVFARLMTPYVVSELGRRGYNVNILEA